MGTKYTVDYFINKFKAIPPSKWTTGELINESGQCCALGHCGMVDGGLSNDWTEEGLTLDNLFSGCLPQGAVAINDGDDGEFTQKTPKGRILAALRKIKRARS